MKKKVLALVLMLAMVLSLTACGKKNEPADDGTKTETNNDAGTENKDDATDNTEDTDNGDAEASTPKVGGQIVIGDTTQPNGDVYPYWTNNASDYSVYNLCFGYGTITGDHDGKFIVDPMVVEKMDKTENADGSKTVTFKLCEDLKWSNGEQITAKDYVFHLLFFSSPEVIELGSADNTSGYYLTGYEDFANGNTKVFSGVRLLGDYEFAITIDASNLPYYYEDAMAGYGPSHMAGWMPADVDIKDDGEGAYFTEAFTVDNIKDTVNSYRMNLKAFSGPYMVDHFDATNNAYTLKANPEFKGNFEGQKANIETVIYKMVVSETMMDELATGAVDLIRGCAEGGEINAGLDLVDAGTHGYYDYARNGYGRLVFVCDRGPSQFAEVRRAVAYLLDRNEFARTFTGGFGSVVNACYGSAQWMAEEAEEQIAALNPYNKSLDAAVKELVDGGWVYDANGNDYVEGIRYKKMDDGTYMPLIIEWCSSENNPVSDLLVTMLANGEDTAAAGMQINQTVVTFNELINNLYQLQDNNYNMYNLAVGFTSIFDQTETYKIDGSNNQNRIADEQLAALAKDMCLVPSGDDDAYLAKWVAFQQRYNELLPDLPLYANQYHDFFTNRVKGYEDINDVSWGLESQLPYCWVED